MAIFLLDSPADMVRARLKRSRYSDHIAAVVMLLGSSWNSVGQINKNTQKRGHKDENNQTEAYAPGRAGYGNANDGFSRAISAHESKSSGGGYCARFFIGTRS